MLKFSGSSYACQVWLERGVLFGRPSPAAVGRRLGCRSTLMREGTTHSAVLAHVPKWCVSAVAPAGGRHTTTSFKPWGGCPPQSSQHRHAQSSGGRGVTDTDTSMLQVERNVRSKIWWFTEFCVSHYVSHFTAFFIVVGAKTSTAKSCMRLTFASRCARQRWQRCSDVGVGRVYASLVLGVGLSFTPALPGARQARSGSPREL